MNSEDFRVKVGIIPWFWDARGVTEKEYLYSPLFSLSWICAPALHLTYFWSYALVNTLLVGARGPRQQNWTQRWTWTHITWCICKKMTLAWNLLTFCCCWFFCKSRLWNSIKQHETIWPKLGRDWVFLTQFLLRVTAIFFGEKKIFENIFFKNQSMKFSYMLPAFYNKVLFEFRRFLFLYLKLKPP